MYCCHNWQKIAKQDQKESSSKPSTSSRTFIPFWKSTENFQHFQKKIIFRALTYPKLLLPKNVVTWMLLNSCFRTPFGNQPVKGSKTLLKFARQQFYANVPLISNKLSCVSCLLVGSEMLGHFFETLTADHMYSCDNWQKLPQQIQGQLSSKPSTSSQSFIKFSKPR